MTVMHSNYCEIPAFIDLARQFGFRASFSCIRGIFGNENIFEMSTRKPSPICGGCWPA
jgi:hypothetical protein